MVRYICCWASLLVLVFTTTILVLPTHTSAAAPLPGTPIWAAGSTEPGSVALFRYRFTTHHLHQNVQLKIFADTRYEAWVDGAWVGRGPARFSHVRQEFDTLAVADMPPGEHVLAVLVQYAPNVRRSESIQAGLQASLHSTINGQPHTVASTGEQWRVLVSPAWNRHAEQVHAWYLIGPQELLDLRKLPPDWHTLQFDDSAWPSARPLPASTFAHLVPRSIEPLHFLPRAPRAIVEAGLVSPGQHIVDVDAPQPTTPEEIISMVPRFPEEYQTQVYTDIPYQPTPPPTTVPTATREITLAARHATRLVLETATPFNLQINDRPVSGWQQPGDERRPDMHVLEYSVPAGEHRLHFDVPAGGVAFAIADKWQRNNSPALELATPLHQGNNPGRRMLLGNPIPGGSEDMALQLDDTVAHATIMTSTHQAHYVLLDFGRTLHARPSLIAAGPPGTIVDIGWEERLIGGRALPAPGSLHHHLWQQVDSWVLDGTPRRLTTIDTRAGRYMLLVIWGSGPVRLSHIHAVEETYVSHIAGSFTSSDPLLNRIWQVGADTLIPSMTDAYADPWRERGQWWGDLYAAFHINRAAVGDTSLLRRGLVQLADAADDDGRLPPLAPAHGDPGFMLDYGMLWVEGLHTYWQLTGDTDLVRELLPTAERFMSFVQEHEHTSGLLFLPHDAHWSQSALIDWAGVSSRTGESAALNAQYAATLRWMAEMSRAVGGEHAAAYEERSQAVRAALRKRLYLADQHAFATSRFEDLTLTPSAQAQAWALAYDAVAPYERDRVARSLLEQLTPFWRGGTPEVELYGIGWVLKALGKSGYTTEALALIREQYGGLLQAGATTWWETFTSDQRHDASLSHAWGGSPTWFLTSHVLGAEQTGPATWRVAPHPADLRYARGTLPLPQGALTVSWKIPAEGEFDLHLEAPPETSGTLLLPISDTNVVVYHDEQLLWRRDIPPHEHITRKTDGILIADAAAGHYQVRHIEERESEIDTRALASCAQPWARQQMKVKDHTLFAHDNFYYIATTQITLPLQSDRGEFSFGYARTQDFCTWEELAPALWAAGDADEAYIWAPHVIEEDGTFYMFYTSVNANIAQRIALATTTTPHDPASWVRQGIVFQPEHAEMVYAGPHTWSDARDPMILRYQGGYLLYYTGLDSSGGIIGVATADALRGPWHDRGAVLRMPDNRMPESPFVVPHAGHFYLYFNAAGNAAHALHGPQWHWSASPFGPWHSGAVASPGWAHDFFLSGSGWLASYVLGNGEAIGVAPLQWQQQAAQPAVVPRIHWDLFLPLLAH